MIIAGLLLLAIGCADLVRQFVPRRRQWIGYVAVLVLVLAVGVGSGALAATVLAPVLGAVWIWAMPVRRPAPLAFWPAVVLALGCVLAVVLVGDRSAAGLLDGIWQVDSPFGPVPFDLAVLVIGVLLFLLESANLVVRAALAGERVWRPAEDSGRADKTDTEDAAPPTHPADDGAEAVARPAAAFSGGRLIGPLERVLVFLLTLVPAYPLLAAMLAAKGIVRFPEISRDGETGARAEYFLIGSLVSWVCALGGALLVWWAANS